MKCRFCGRDLRPVGATLNSSHGTICMNSPSKKHMAISDGQVCVYCGRNTRTVGQNLYTDHGQQCLNAPNKKHVLQ